MGCRLLCSNLLAWKTKKKCGKDISTKLGQLCFRTVYTARLVFLKDGKSCIVALHWCNHVRTRKFCPCISQRDALQRFRLRFSILAGIYIYRMIPIGFWAVKAPDFRSSLSLPPSNFRQLIVLGTRMTFAHLPVLLFSCLQLWKIKFQNFTFFVNNW